MVNIDTVYQKVLIFANKEQRGYVTPQEFNMFADQAQKEIFEQYFYDLKQFNREPGSSTEYSDIVDNINEKISIFETKAGVSQLQGTLTNGAFDLAGDLYRLGTVMYPSYGSSTTPCEVEEVQQNELLYINKSPLLKPTVYRPIYVRENGSNTVQLYPTSLSDDTEYTYIKIPSKPNWGYVVVNGKAMYDSFNVNHFELHPSEENELVYKILKFAGLAMKRDDVARGGQGLETMQQQQEKA